MRQLAAVLLFLSLAASAAAEEGMWTFDNFPSEKVREAYGFAPDKPWLDRVQRNAVKYGNGCSAAIVSKEGLILTNHHCALSCVSDLSSARSDYVAAGFRAASRREERVCPGLEVAVLESTSDVTQRVNAALEAASAGDREKSRTATIEAIEREGCGADRRKKCDVVDLYHGGQFKLYRYRRFSDVRLAFAPELQAAFFGGDPDNFNFPRYAFDVALLRIYEAGKPAHFDDPLQLETLPVKEGELMFVAGHPAATQRLLVPSQLEFLRDDFLPWRIEYFAQLRGELSQQAQAGEEEARQVNEALFGVENALKVFKGERAALVEPSLINPKAREQETLRDLLAKQPGLQAKYGDPFHDLQAVSTARRRLFLAYELLERSIGAGSQLLYDARILSRAGSERLLPEARRRPEYSRGRLLAMEQSVTSETPILPILEELEIAFWLEKTRECLGADHPTVRAMFGTRTSHEIAHEIATQSELGDVAVRRAFWEHPEKLATARDPALRLLRAVESGAREARDAWTREVESPTAAASAKLAALRFETSGATTYPDATSTLRLSYGSVRGWNDPTAGDVRPFTHVAGLWARATGAFPFNLSANWAKARGAIGDDVLMNFVTTNDIIGGNSGSPVLNQRGKVFGAAFDGNIHSLGGAFGYDGALNRTVVVSAPLILEGLRKVYGLDALADELVGK